MESDSRNLKSIMFHADDISSIKIYKFILQKIELDSAYLFRFYLFCFRPILNVFQKLMPLLRVCVKVNIRENRIFKIFKDYTLLSFVQIPDK